MQDFRKQSSEKKPSSSKSLFAKKDKSSGKLKESTKESKESKAERKSSERALAQKERKIVEICEIPVPLDNTIKWRQPLAEVDSREMYWTTLCSSPWCRVQKYNIGDFGKMVRKAKGAADPSSFRIRTTIDPKREIAVSETEEDILLAHRILIAFVFNELPKTCNDNYFEFLGFVTAKIKDLLILTKSDQPLVRSSSVSLGSANNSNNTNVGLMHTNSSAINTNSNNNANDGLAANSVAESQLSEMAEEKIPPSFLCPISAELMTDPVMVVDSGMVYDRVSIEAWFVSHNTDPMTNQALNSKTLVGVLTLKNAIVEYRQLHAIPNNNSNGEKK